jgi:hypothetical protein
VLPGGTAAVPSLTPDRYAEEEDAGSFLRASWRTEKARTTTVIDDDDDRDGPGA